MEYVIDTSVLLQGGELPPGETWVTTPEADNEISPGGRNARKWATWKEIGLHVVSASPEALVRVRGVARAAGNENRLSAADCSLLALAWERRATILSDDLTILDVARRMRVIGKPVHGKGISGTIAWESRCSGCGRQMDNDGPKECQICGSPVRRVPKTGGRSL